MVESRVRCEGASGSRLTLLPDSPGPPFFPSSPGSPCQQQRQKQQRWLYMRASLNGTQTNKQTARFIVTMQVEADITTGPTSPGSPLGPPSLLSPPLIPWWEQTIPLKQLFHSDACLGQKNQGGSFSPGSGAGTRVHSIWWRLVHMLHWLVAVQLRLSN